MLYKDQPNTLEMAKAFFHLILSIIVCVATVWGLFRYEVLMHGILSDIQINVVLAMINILTLIMIFIIFNTSYYAFVSYQRIKMLVFAINFLFLGCTGVIYTLQRLFVGMNGVTSESLLYANDTMIFGNVIFVIGVLISAFVPFETRLNERNQSLLRLIPLLGLVSFIAILFPFNYYVSNIDPEIVHFMMNKLYMILLLIAIVTNLVLFIRDNNGYLIRVCSGMLFLLTAQLVHVFVTGYPEVVLMGSEFLKLLGFVIIFFAVFKFNVGLPLKDLKNTERQIKLYADNLERIIEKRTSEVRKANEKFIRELDYAKSIQQSLLPAKKPVFKDVQFVSEYFPCERLSGDFYDIYRIDDENIGMYVLDVSGHGISAALMTMFCNNVIKSTEKLIKRYRGLKPHRNLFHFYEEFNKMNFPDEMHMVIFYASYNMETGVLTYCSGGMNCHPILVRENGDLVHLDQSKGFPICKMADFYVPEYSSAHIKLEKNDSVIFYTDGLVDKDKNKCMDDDEFEHLLKENKDKSLVGLNTQITNKITPNLNQIDDDITYFIMKVSKGDKNEGYTHTEGTGTD